MDNQNAKKNGLTGIAGDIFRGEANITTEADVKRATDAAGTTNAEDVVIRPQNYENVQTQSVVETAREQAEKELQQIKAYNDEMLRRQKIEEAKGKAKRSAARTAIVIFVIVVIVALVFLLINILTNIYNPPAPTPAPAPPEPVKYDVVDGYKCTSSNCYKMAELPDGRIFLRDDDYRIYDSTSGEVVTTTIENQEYFSVVPFVWGDDILIDLDHESGFNGIYSVNGNRMITGFTYDEFYKDINYEGYDEMRWIEGQYIIARKDHDFRLIRLRDGQDLIRANKRVFVHGQFLIAYNDNGERRVYDLEGKQLRVAVPKSNIYIQNDLMVYADYTDSLFFDLMNSKGEFIGDGAEIERLYSIEYESFLTIMDKDPNYYKIPANN
jgi:hypothetical protein